MGIAAVNINLTQDRENCGRSRVAILLLLMSAASPAAATANHLFEQHEVVTGIAKHQTVLSGFFLGGTTAELMVVCVDKDDDRRVQMYGFDGNAWVSLLDAALSSEVSFVDMANVGGHDRLITYERGRLNWFDPESATERMLVAVNSDIEPPRKGGIPHVDVTQDVNADDRDDLVVPHNHGFYVFIQTSDGTFADPVKIGPSTGIGGIYAAYGYRHDPWDHGRVHETDYNQDGRDDLVFWNEDHFEVHLQDERGLFSLAAKTFKTEVAFDSDELASLAAPYGVRRRLMDHNPGGDLTGRVLHSLTDMNGDEVADLVVFSLEGGSLRKMQAVYEVHFGTATADGIVFAPEVGTKIESDGIPFGMRHHDFDHDGQVDMMFTITKVGTFKAIRMLIDAVLTDSVLVDLELYRMQGGVYPDKPTATRRAKTTSFGKSGERATVFPSVLIGEVNGDRYSDLLVQNRRDELRVFLGVPGPRLFARRPQKVAVAMPNEEYVWLVDLNRDGKQDLLMHHASATEPHRLIMLIAR